MVTPGWHIICGWFLHHRWETHAWLTPTILGARVTWDSESCADHPEASRAVFDVWVPAVTWPALGWDLGGVCRTFVNAQGIDDNGAETNKHVAYFEGETDGIAVLRDTRGHAPITAVTDLAATPPVWPSDGTAAVAVSPDGTGFDVTNNSDTQAEIQFTVNVTPPPGWTGNGLRIAAVNTGLYGDNTVVNSGGGWAVTNLEDGPVATRVAVRTVPPNTTVKVIVTVMEEHRGRPPGYQVQVTASDYLARLGRLSIGDEPWGWDSIEYRCGRIRNLAARTGLYVDSYPRRDVGGAEPGGWQLFNTNNARPLDVDHRSALDVYRRAVAGAGRVALGLAGRVGISWALQPTKTIAVAAGVASLVDDRVTTSEVPSDAVPDVPMHLTADRVATRVTVRWWRDNTDTANTHDTTDTTWKIDAPAALQTRYGVIDRVIETDQYHPDLTKTLPDIAANLASKAQLMLAEQSEPEPYFGDGVTVVPRDLDRVRGLAELIDNASRFGRAIRFTGPLPAGLDREHRVKGGSWEWDGRTWALALSTEPVNFSGPEAGTIAQAAARPEFTIGSGTNVTIKDMRSVKL